MPGRAVNDMRPLAACLVGREPDIVNKSQPRVNDQQKANRTQHVRCMQCGAPIRNIKGLLHLKRVKCRHCFGHGKWSKGGGWQMPGEPIHSLSTSEEGRHETSTRLPNGSIFRNFQTEVREVRRGSALAVYQGQQHSLFLLLSLL